MLQRLLLISEAEAAVEVEVAAPILLLLLMLLGSNEEEEEAVVAAAVGGAEIPFRSMSSLLSLPRLLVSEAEEAEALPPRADCSKIGRSYYCRRRHHHRHRSHHYQLSHSHPVHLPAYVSAVSAVGSGVHNCHNIRHMSNLHTRDLHTSDHPPLLRPRRRCSPASRPRRSPRR